MKKNKMLKQILNNILKYNEECSNVAESYALFIILYNTPGINTVNISASTYIKNYAKNYEIIFRCMNCGVIDFNYVNNVIYDFNYDEVKSFIVKSSQILKEYILNILLKYKELNNSIYIEIFSTIEDQLINLKNKK